MHSYLEAWIYYIVHRFSIKHCISVSENCFILAYDTGPDEMLKSAASNLDLHCLKFYISIASSICKGLKNTYIFHNKLFEYFQMQ